MRNSPKPDWALAVFDGLFKLGRLTITVALTSILGFMLFGGILGTLAQLLNLNTLARHVAAIGWCLGAVAGLAHEIPLLLKPGYRVDDENEKAEDPGDDDAVEHPAKRYPIGLRSAGRFQFPALTQMAKTVGVFTLLGVVLGAMTSVGLCILLIAVTTSPFVPDGWRSGSGEYDQSARDQPHQRHRSEDRAEVGSSFTHPLIGPIVFYSLTILASLGVALGVVASFFATTEAPKDGPL